MMGKSMISILFIQAITLLFAIISVQAKQLIVPHPCFLKPETGPCKAIIPKYFWNQATKKCDVFTWGGCKGVVPFDTLEECEKARCPYVQCGNPEPIPICRAALPRWKYNKFSNDCVFFKYGGCGPFPPFKTKRECQNTCVRPQ